jgi:predicted aspartyl protease
MKTRSSLPLLVPAALCAAGLLVTPDARAASEAERLLALHQEWRGGDALERQEAVKMEGEMSQAGLEGTVSTVVTRDGLARVDVDLGVVRGAEIVGKEGAWQVNPSGQLEDMAPESAREHLRSAARLFGAPLGGAVEGELQYLGREDKDGRSWEVVRIAYPEGDAYDLFLDPENGSLTWARQRLDTETSWIRWSDWRMVEGARYPFVQETFAPNPAANTVVRWRKVEPLAAPDASLFAPPESRQLATFTGGSDSSGWLPLDLFRGRYLFVKGSIADHPVEIILDTGAGSTVLDRATAERVGVSGGGSLVARGTGGEVEAQLASGVDLEIGELRLSDLTVAIVDLSELASRFGREIPVILGKELFHALVVDIDYPHSRIAFRDPATFGYRGSGHEVALHPAEDGHKRVEIRVGDLPPTLVSLDTGSGRSLTLFRGYAQEHGLLETSAPVSEKWGGGVGGASVVTVTTLPSVTLGGYALRGVPTDLFVGEGGAFDTTREAGNLGAGILSRFRVITDYPRDQMWLEPGEGWDREPFRKDRAGFGLILRDRYLEVAFVAPGSPAEAAGWQEGERIVSVDGEPVRPDYWRGQETWIYRPAGTEVMLVDGAGTARSLRLSDYY